MGGMNFLWNFSVVISEMFTQKLRSIEQFRGGSFTFEINLQLHRTKTRYIAEFWGIYDRFDENRIQIKDLIYFGEEKVNYERNSFRTISQSSVEKQASIISHIHFSAPRYDWRYPKFKWFAWPSPLTFKCEPSAHSIQLQIRINLSRIKICIATYIAGLNS